MRTGRASSRRSDTTPVWMSGCSRQADPIPRAASSASTSGRPSWASPGASAATTTNTPSQGRRSSLAASQSVSRSGVPPVNRASTSAERSRAPASSSSAAASR